ncbi:hypothetical protein N0M98_12850 [Paenibacillus doosanensis]|uniref:Uncharacterized protein n=1 Tax=Paenibacillus konkukensis TaxID=2020716 RepID=A0ABY4RVX5_9BACL|nr:MULTISPECIES: hypothetical protein [Paenibacillus]MCS7461035.1 hypothetical protein [Paenibacillus doosanensis]UQZ85708.1 hypothetical protein SK3146_04997 [Paenibacillus konkukensis]
MYSLLTAFHKAKRKYHKAMHAYNCILYRDCLDPAMKARLLRKLRHHERKLQKPDQRDTP